MQRKEIVLISLGMMICALIGAGIEYVRQAERSDERLNVPKPSSEVLKKRPEARAYNRREDVELHELAQLRKRVSELEHQLAEKSRQQPALAKATKPEEPEQNKLSRRQRWEASMEKLRRENPEQYAEIQHKREEFRQTMEQRTRDRVDFLDAVDERNMTQEQLENHARLVEAVARVNELRASFADESGRTPEKRREMGELMETLVSGYTEERQYLFEETARAVGYQGDDAAIFADHLQTIFENTTLQHPSRRGGGSSH